MEPLNQKSIERVVSQKALQMGSSFPCQICVVGLLCGICLTSLFMAALTSFGTFEFFGGFSTIASAGNSSSEFINCSSKPKVTEKVVVDLLRSEETVNSERASLLYSAWSALLNESDPGERDYLLRHGLIKTNVPNAPHLENCKLKEQVYKRLDKHPENQSRRTAANEHSSYFTNQAMSEATYAGWISGSDEENYPSTRKVQQDIWMHQHPLNCRDHSVKFLVADWERLPGFGIGAQIAGMCGLLAIAMKEKRVLVANYYNRADHDGCKGSSRSSWSCYFFPETSLECRNRALELMENEDAWKNGNIKAKENYTSKQIWAGRTPRIWGEPWSFMQPTTEINGTLITYHRKMDRRWWRAQAVRYLMRFRTEYTCDLLNIARHAAFGKQAANMVVRNFKGEWSKDVTVNERSDIEEFVWSNHKPWMPRPVLSMHVRMGDKACEMKVVEFEDYMSLADRIRKRFPQLNSVWLSTEMQEVIDKSKGYPHWNFYYTNVTRQVGNMTMATYETSLGRETSTNYPLVNFLMATEADYFIGALGSTWCFLIDGMRNTGGKVMAGYLSVNKDRFCDSSTTDGSRSSEGYTEPDEDMLQDSSAAPELSERRKALFEPLEPMMNSNGKRPSAESLLPPPDFDSANYPKGWLIGKKRKLVNVDVVEKMRHIAIQEMNRKDREIDGLNEQLEEDAKCLEHLQLQLLQERSKCGEVEREIERENAMLQDQITMLMDMLHEDGNVYVLVSLLFLYIFSYDYRRGIYIYWCGLVVFVTCS